MYQLRANCPASCGHARGRAYRLRTQRAKCRRSGPEMLVYRPIRPAALGSWTAAQPWIEPQSWPTRWTSVAPTAASTANMSSTSVFRVKSPGRPMTAEAPAFRVS